MEMIVALPELLKLADQKGSPSFVDPNFELARCGKIDSNPCLHDPSDECENRCNTSRPPKTPTGAKVGTGRLDLLTPQLLEPLLGEARLAQAVFPPSNCAWTERIHAIRMFLGFP